MHRASLLVAASSLAACPPPAPSVGSAPSATVSAAPSAVAGDPALSALDGATIERLTSDPGDELFPAPNAAGSLVVYQHEVYEQQGAERVAKRRVLVALEPGAAKQTLLTAEDRASLQPALFPDDRRLAFVTNAFGPLAIVRAEAITPAPTLSVVIGSDLAPALAEPAVSPDGARLALSMTAASGARFVAVVGSDGSKLSPLFEGRSPAWSPKGDQLAFVRSVGGYNHLFAVDANSLQGPRQLTSGELDCDHPTFSPDGARIAFASNLGFKQASRARGELLHLYVIAAQGGAPVAVTRGSARAATPAWSKDGHLYFASDRDGSFDLFRVRAPEAGQGP